MQISNETFKKKIRLPRLRNKEERFFREAMKEEVLDVRLKETELTVFHKGLKPFQMNEGKAKATIQLMLDFFIDIIDARKDEGEPVMLVLSYIPKTPEGIGEIVKKSHTRFITWAKQFKGVEIDTIPKSEIDKLGKEYAQKWEKYYRDVAS